jgi:hypothetical protein
MDSIQSKKIFLNKKFLKMLALNQNKISFFSSKIGCYSLLLRILTKLKNIHKIN